MVTANPEIFMLGRKLPEMNEALSDEETLIVPDGIGVIRGGKQLGYEFEERIPGVEICEELFAYADQKGRSLYLFGAEKSVLEDLAARVRREYPNAVLAAVRTATCRIRRRCSVRSWKCSRILSLWLWELRSRSC